MVHYKLKPTKSETCYRLIPTLMYIIAISSVVLTFFFMVVLKSKNAYELDSEHFDVNNDEFKMEITGATSDQLANLDIHNLNFEDSTRIFTKPQSPPFETFLLTKTISPTTGNHIKTNNNQRNMKAYKIVSKEPIIGNSLMKIVMAPQHVLEKLSQQHHNNKKYGLYRVDKSGNAPTKEYGIDDGIDRRFIQNENGNVNVEVFSLEDDGNVGFMVNTQSNKNAMHHDSNNIQVIAKSHKQPLNMISMDRNNPFDSKERKRVVNDANTIRGEGVVVNDLQTTDVDMEAEKTIPEIESSDLQVPTTTEAIVIDSTYAQAEEMLSNPTTSLNLIQTLIPEDVKSEEDKVSTEMNSSSHHTSFENLENSRKASLQVSTENNVPVVVLKILKNRTVLVEETNPQSSPDQFSMESTATVLKSLPHPQIIRPKKITKSTVSPIAVEAKQSQFEMTTRTSLSDVETTNLPPQSQTTTKSKNIKRAVGDEGTFGDTIVRPSPIVKPININDLFPRETDAERAERLNKAVHRLMHVVAVLGHVDSLITRRVRHGLKNVARVFESMEDTR